MSDEKIIITVDSDLEELIPGFLENRSKDIVSLKDAMTEEDYQKIQSIGHSLKGVGGGYGFQKISELGAAIENSAKAQDLASITELIEQYADYLDRLEVSFE